MIKSLPIEVEEIMKNRKEGDHLKSMVEVRQENEKLKSTISQIMKNYHSLKLHFHDILQQDQSQKSIDSAASDDESELVSLSLGRFSCDSKRDQKKNSYKTKHQNERKVDGLELGLDSKFHSIEVSKNLSPENCSDELKGEENNITHKGSKVARSGDDEILELEQNPLKKPRVSVRLVCNTQTINDGCQWRKYGQKVAKGNPCPRAYYRCTMSSSCPVRKQVQRCAQDMSILTTTYEGTHNHPLPPSAASMASATSAAAAMLNCGSTTSPPLHGGSATPSTFTFNFPSSSTNTLAARTSITTSQSHPTVVLDLTPPNHTSSPCNFSSSSLFSTYNPQLSIYNKLIQASQQGIVSDNIAAATKVITRNPTFQSALAAAITSFVGNGSISNLDQDRKNVKWGENISFSQSLN